MSEIKVNKISPRTNCGTVQLGDSGDTITIPAGATITNNGTQTGFGRTGTVNWQTGDIKTANFTAASGEGYFCDTATTGAFTLTLPASPNAGDIVGIKDYASNFGTANLTIGRNGSNINGAAVDPVLSTQGQSVFLVYVDATKGWIPTQDDSSSIGATFVAATGGTITTCGNFKIHTFTGPGTFTVTCAGSSSGSNTIDYLVVAGGGGGGRTGGGGGGGGVRFFASPDITSYPASPNNGPTALPVTATGYPVTVGAGGGAQANPGCQGGDGSVSTFAGTTTITSTGGGGGGGPGPGGTTDNGRAGGSGGGMGRDGGPSASVGAGNTPPVSPPQGNDGGQSPTTGYSGGGGGGGFMAVGGNAIGGPPACVEAGGNGGIGGGFPTNFVSTNGQPSSCEQYFGGGAGGGANGSRPDAATYGQGATGGGGNGGIHSPHPQSRASVAGTVNTGGGGGGSGSSGEVAAAGGSGIVIIRYKFQ